MRAGAQSADADSFRVLQGAGGGGLGPSEQAILADTFPAAKRGMAFAVYGMAVVLAPAIGPTLGGWITDNYSWRWIFYVNIPFGILSLSSQVSWCRIRRICKKQADAKHQPVDFMGLALVGTGLGTLQVVLDKGQRDDWFALRSSPYSHCRGMRAGGIRVLGMEPKASDCAAPVVPKSEFRGVRAADGDYFRGAVGCTVLLPEFAQTNMGYTRKRRERFYRRADLR